MRFYGYKIPLLASPFPFSIREGILLETERGGWGEAAYLPGFSIDLLSSFIFAKRCAKLPFFSTYPSLSISALARNLFDAETALQSGFETIKYKVSGLSPEHAAADVRQLQTLSVSLRIDANRCWSVEEASRFLSAIEPINIEYIEEPVSDPGQLAKLPPFPFAYDETLLNPSADLRHVQTLVLKPTLLGDRLDTWIEKGKQLGKQLVFSSSYESAIGLIHLAWLQKTHAPNTAAGLDTYRAFAKNFLPFPIKNGKLQEQPIPPINLSC